MSDYTHNEIYSQPEIWNIIIEKADQYLAVYETIKAECSQNDLLFIGCGTSYYLALSAASVFSFLTGVKANAIPASDMLFFPEQQLCCSGKDTLCIFISRSGTTTEVLRAADHVKSHFKASSCAITCRPEGKLAKQCANSFVIPEADEKSVVMTRSFTSMLLLIQIMAAHRAGNQIFMNELKKLPERGGDLMALYKKTARTVFSKKQYSKYVYMGQGPFYGLACEAMLKVKEMSLSASEAYHSLEFRHGPMSMVDHDMLLIFFISEKAFKDEVRLLKEMKSLDANTLVICERADDEVRSAADFLIELQSGISDYARLILYIPIVQFLGYELARLKNLDPDNPKNLSQVVEF